LFRIGAGEAEVEAMEMDVLVDGAGAVEGVELRHDAHASARQCGGVNYIDSGDVNGACSGKDARGADADSRCFAGAIWAEQTVQFTFANTEFDAVYGDNTLFAFIDLAKAFHLDNWCQTSPQSNLYLLLE
jgi:hypothetical protein